MLRDAKPGELSTFSLTIWSHKNTVWEADKEEGTEKKKNYVCSSTSLSCSDMQNTNLNPEVLSWIRFLTAQTSGHVHTLGAELGIEFRRLPVYLFAWIAAVELGDTLS